MADTNVSSVLKLMKDNDCDILDLKFIDVPGTWQHVALPIAEVNDDYYHNIRIDPHRSAPIRIDPY